MCEGNTDRSPRNKREAHPYSLVVPVRSPGFHRVKTEVWTTQVTSLIHGMPAGPGAQGPFLETELGLSCATSADLTTQGHLAEPLPLFLRPFTLCPAAPAPPCAPPPVFPCGPCGWGSSSLLRLRVIVHIEFGNILAIIFLTLLLHPRPQCFLLLAGTPMKCTLGCLKPSP